MREDELSPRLVSATTIAIPQEISTSVTSEVRLARIRSPD